MVPKINIRSFAIIPLFVFCQAVGGIEQSGADVALEASWNLEPSSSWWCSDVSPWRKVDDTITDDCKQLVSVRDHLPSFKCPSCPSCPICPPQAPPCPPAAPVIPTIDAAKDWPISTTKEKDAKDMENIKQFCLSIQDNMPLIRPNDTYSAILNLQQKGWTEEPFFDTKVSVKILHQFNPKDEGFWTRLVGHLTNGLSNIGKRPKGSTCDRTNEEQTEFKTCMDSVHGLWERKNTERGGYKAWPTVCTLYDWEPVWPGQRWPIGSMGTPGLSFKDISDGILGSLGF